MRGCLKNHLNPDFNLYYPGHVLEKLGMREYPSSLTDSEWEIIRPLFPASPLAERGRPREHSRRSILDGILYIIRTGGAWRMMSHNLPHRKACYHYFRLRAKQGHWERIHNAIRDLARLTPAASSLR